MSTSSGAKLEKDENDGEFVLPSDHRLAGWTVDALLEQGKIDEARIELERLVQQGIDSGPGIPVTPEYWEGLRAIARGETRTKR
jgi:hypothetical protein